MNAASIHAGDPAITIFIIIIIIIIIVIVIFRVSSRDEIDPYEDILPIYPFFLLKT